MSWERQKLGDLVQTQKGYAFKSAWYQETGRPIVKVSDFTEESVDTKSLVKIPEDIAEKFLRWELSAGEAVVQTVGSWPSNPASVVGKCVRIPSAAHGALLNQNAVRLSPYTKLDNGYLYYSLRSRQFRDYIIGTARGSANQASITLDAIRAFGIPLPHVDIQRRIVSTLSAYDDLIENNRRRIQLLEQAARLLYREWFVHLRFPGHEHVTITDGVPEGWEKEPLFDIASPTYGFAFKSKLFNTDGEGVPVARIRNIPSGESQTYTTEEAPEDKLLEDGEFVIGMDGDFHMNFWTGGKTWINQRVVRIKGVGDFNDAFLRYACEKPIQDFNATIAGTTVAHLGAKHLKLIELLIPPKGILYEAQDFFDSTQSQIVALSNQSRLAKNARDLLLPRLMNGAVVL